MKISCAVLVLTQLDAAPKIHLQSHQISSRLLWRKPDDGRSNAWRMIDVGDGWLAASNARSGHEVSIPIGKEPRVLPCPCPRCGGRMIVIEAFERGCEPTYRPTS